MWANEGSQLSAKSYLVTGGTGFIGSALVRQLLSDGFHVRVLDDNSRGAPRRLKGVESDVEMVDGDVRDAAAVQRACQGVDGICHLAYVNGTEFFYEKPDLVLDVGVKGMINVIDGALAGNIGELILASSSEVYQTPDTLPTPEDVPLIIPDVFNPRYSYGGGKIISELLAINYGRQHFDRVQIFRPHNVYGPDMGWEHVLPQFVLRMKGRLAAHDDGPLAFPIQGSGDETRAFVFIDDMINGVRTMMERGDHLGVYHIGAMEEVSIADTARLVGKYFGCDIQIEAGELQAGGTPRRCPDIAKLAALGFAPKTPLADGLPILAEWYDNHADLAP